MQTVGSPPQRKSLQCRDSGTPRRWLVLLLIIAVAVSGFRHAVESHDAAAANYSQEVVVTSADDCSDPCCRDHGGQAHRTTCTTMGGCSFCAPLAGTALLAFPGTGSAGRIPETVHSGRIQTPDIRPPKLLQNV